MSARDNGGPAFPVPPSANENAAPFDGMSLRDYFAATALAGMLADHTMNTEPHEYAIRCYGLADAMLKARKA